LGRFLVPGLFDGEHYFIIEACPEGGVRFIQGGPRCPILDYVFV